MLSLLLASSVASCIPAPPQEQATLDLTGHWEGTIEVAGLDFDVDLAGDPLTGDLSIPAQSLRDLELIDLVLDGETLRFALPDSIPGEARFEGTVEAGGETASGTFTQSGRSMPFSMARAEDPIEAARGRLADYGAWATDSLDRFKVPGLTVAVVYRGEVVLAQGYGMRDAERELPVGPDTLFAIGSTTKAFTTFALAQAVERGELEWDEPVRRYLPELDLVDDHAELHLSLRDLVTHRSGLPRHDLIWYLHPERTRTELVASLAHLEPSFGLRETWQYNNLMYVTAGVALERVTGKAWEENLREGILGPLGMARTSFGPAAAVAAGDAAVAHDRRRGKTFQIPFRDIESVGPAGSIHSSANDMARWLACLLGNGTARDEQLLGPGAFSELVLPVAALPMLLARTEASPTAYALGWMVDNHRGHLRVHHDGGIDGFTATVQLFPGDDLGIFTATNRTSSLTGVSAAELLTRVLDLEPSNAGASAESAMSQLEQLTEMRRAGAASERIEGAPPAHPLEAYAAAYAHPAYGDIAVTRTEDGLHLRMGTFESPLEPWHYEVFKPSGDDVPDELAGLLFRFETDFGGFVSALDSQLEPAVEPIRFEREPDIELFDLAHLERLAGTYTLPLAQIEIALVDDHLTLQVAGQPAVRLDPWTHGRFELRDAEGYHVRFRFDEGGEVTGLVIHQPDGTYAADRM